MLQRFRNKELLNATKKVTVVTILVIILSVVCINFSLTRINSVIVDSNAALFGRIVSEYPELENKIVGIYTREISKEDEAFGKEKLSKYGYDSSMNYMSNKAMSEVYMGFTIQYILIIIFLITIVYLIFYRSMDCVYKDITNVSALARRVVEGEFNRIAVNYNEGDIPIFKESFNLMVESLEKNIKLLNKEKNFLNDLISDITHQLKTPLSSLIMFNDLMETLTIDDVTILEDCIQSSREQLARMEWLVQSLLKLARLESGSIVFSKKETSIRSTLEEAIKPFKLIAGGEDRIKISGDLDIQVSHDPHWTAEALSNLVKNAVEHSESDKEIHVICEAGPIFVTIKVIDYGKGINKEERSKIFTRFYRGSNNKNTNSIGIGLSLTKSIIEGQGGEIKVYSEEGEGTTFVITMYKKNQEVI